MNAAEKLRAELNKNIIFHSKYFRLKVDIFNIIEMNKLFKNIKNSVLTPLLANVQSRSDYIYMCVCTFASDVFWLQFLIYTNLKKGFC